MQLILLSKGRGHLAQMRLDSARVWGSVFVIALLVCAGAFYGGFRAAEAFGISNPGAQAGVWRAELAQQQSVVDGTRRALQQNLDALALRLGQMNAHVVRLDALGQRLTQMAGLKDGEFDFTSEPSLGGPEEPIIDADSSQMKGVVGALDLLDHQLSDRARQLTVLEDLLINRKLALRDMNTMRDWQVALREYVESSYKGYLLAPVYRCALLPTASGRFRCAPAVPALTSSLPSCCPGSPPWVTRSSVAGSWAG